MYMHTYGCKASDQRSSRILTKYELPDYQICLASIIYPTSQSKWLINWYVTLCGGRSHGRVEPIIDDLAL